MPERHVIFKAEVAVKSHLAESVERFSSLTATLSARWDFISSGALQIKFRSVI